jgi:hypothetical protein
MVLVQVARLVFAAVQRPDGTTRHAFEVRRVVSVQVESSWKNLTSRATVQLPSRWLFLNNKIDVKEWVRVGDPLAVSLGYNKTYVPEFAGYVTGIKPGVPVTLTCEDAMYQLKRFPVRCSYAGVKLRQLLRDICPKDLPIEAPDVAVGHFMAANTTVAKVLEKLKELYGFVSYFRGGTLYCGEVYHQARPAVPTTFNFQRSGPGAVLQDELEYRDGNSLRVIVTATSHQLKGKDLKVVVGDTTALDAEPRTLQYFNLDSEADLRAAANRDLQRLKVEGYQGSFTTYGLPSMQHGQVARLESSLYPERNGDFFIDATEKTFDSGGYRQKITLGSQAALAGL